MNQSTKIDLLLIRNFQLFDIFVKEIVQAPCKQNELLLFPNESFVIFFNLIFNNKISLI